MSSGVTSTTESVIEISNLSKYYGETVGIENLDLNIKKGEIFGFLGQNGAGKTTTIRCLLNILIPDTGEIKILDQKISRDNPQIKEKIGYLPGELYFPDNYKVNDFFAYINSLRNKEATRLQELVNKFDIPVSKRIKELSRGNKQKVGLAIAMMHDPEILILDEPTASLDPLNQNILYNILLEEKTRGKTIFFSSHNLDEVQKICDRVAIIQEGKLISVENVKELHTKVQRRLIVSFESITDQDLENFEELVIRKDLELNEVDFKIKNYDAIGPLLDKLSNLNILDVSYPSPSLEEYFLTRYNKLDEAVA